MSSPNPPKDLQVVAPAAQPQQAGQVQQPTPQVQPPAAAPEPKKDHVDPVPPEDRILSPEETERLFKTGSTEEPAPEAPATPGEADQSQQAASFFEEVPVGGRVPGQPPQELPVQVGTQAVEQTLQQGQSTPVQQAPPPGAQPVPAPAVAIPQQTPQEAALAAQVQGLQTQLQNLTTQLQAVQTQAVQQPQQPSAAAPQFNMQIPAGHMQALASEDPAVRTEAMNAIVNGVAETVRKQTQLDMDRRFEGVNPIIQQQITAAQGQADVKRDMYGTYPELSNMMEQVVAVAQQMQNQGLTNGQWSADLRDAIAERLSPMVPGLQQKVQQVRNARLGPQQQQLLPQVPQQLPPGVQPTQVAGGAHVPVAQGPMLVRDVYGNVSQVHPQQHQQIAGPQARPGGQGQIDPKLQDIWSTLGYI